MKKTIIIMLAVLGGLLCLIDVDNMAIFFATKVVGILLMLPVLALDFEE